MRMYGHHHCVYKMCPEFACHRGGYRSAGVNQIRSGVLPMTHIIAREVSIPMGALMLPGVLRVPREARGIVLFTHDRARSGPHAYVAERLWVSRLASLLLDLVPAAEEASASTQDIPLLTDRLIEATIWTQGHLELENLRIGYFGSNIGAAAALAAAARIPGIGAVVSASGRPDLAGTALTEVRAATLLIVGAQDKEVVALNRSALEQLTCEAQLELIPTARHLLDEPGILERVSSLATEWFERHIGEPVTTAA
jgi:putative phosphoribosyl transferase